ncbi:MAG TPA: paraquat-inducible protein A [Verrucomicrobiae bacterium]|nr:paraquat-inducible protein A [Verrucomicrobiae bacterium]
MNSALITTHPRAGWTVLLMLLTALGCFFAGIFLPFTAVTKLWLFSDQVSVCQGLVIFWKAREIFLFLILFVFTVCFPFVKMNALLALWLYPRLTADRAKAFYKFVSHLGKWSMLDVFVVAILVLTLRSSTLASIRVGNGFFLFFISVMLTQFSSTWTGHIAGQLEK